jgi:hypothetical protein
MLFRENIKDEMTLYHLFESRVLGGGAIFEVLSVGWGVGRRYSGSGNWELDLGIWFGLFGSVVLLGISIGRREAGQCSDANEWTATRLLISFFTPSWNASADKISNWGWDSLGTAALPIFPFQFQFLRHLISLWEIGTWVWVPFNFL